MKPVLFSVLLLVSCASPRTEAPRKETTVRALSPVRVTWEEVSRTDTEAVVLAKVERVLAMDLPFTLSVDVPAGATVASGRTRLTLLPNTEAVTVTEKITFTFEATPVGDAVLGLDGDTGAMGFHFKVPYRFGRAPPPELAPAATGPAVKKGDKNFGPSIPLK